MNKSNNNSYKYSSGPLFPTSTTIQTDVVNKLHKHFTFEQIEELHQIFLNHNNTLSYTEFRTILEEFNVMLTDNQYLTLFLKLNLNRNNEVNWDEFVSYLIFSFQEDNPYSQKEKLTLPIPERPIAKNSNHKTPIISMTILDNITTLDDDKEFGYYITASKDGIINFWSPELEVIRKGLSKSQYLKYTSTWVIGVVALSDVRIICVSSTERELRFYDVTAINFHLRVVIRCVPYAIGIMSYAYSRQDDVNSKLFLGDTAGNIRVLEFSSRLRGPFKSSANSILIELSWSQVLKGKFPGVRVTEYLNVFHTNITQVYYSYKLDTIYISAATYSKNHDKAGIIAIDSRGTRNLFYVPEGVTTFCLDEINSVLATGGPDTFLRFWEPYVSTKASAILEAHRSGIVYIFIQSTEKLCYSIDILKTIKVWHIIDLTVLQTFSELRALTSEKQFSYIYNRLGHELIIGGRQLISIRCSAKIEYAVTDGNTHAGPVSVVLYNQLFENIVTCGLDSYIIVWDVWTGKRQIIMKRCHTMDSMQLSIDVEITAATFDPSQQFLITGARDGSLKIWNYNNAVCTRNLRIDDRCEVSNIFWIPDRILVVGWNQVVTQFADVKGLEYSDGTNWIKIHKTDITAAAYKPGEILVTGSYFGNLVFWKVETGQPYRMHMVKYPQQFCDMYSEKRIVEEQKVENELKMRDINTNFSRMSVKRAVFTRMMALTDTVLNTEFELDNNEKKKDIRRGETLEQSSVQKLRIKLNLCIQTILILNTRPVKKDHGNVLVAIDNGWVQLYSQHESGGYIGEFRASHKTGDCVNSMTTDKENKYLFTGTSFGFIKVWLLQNYGIPKSEHTHICKPLLRLQFFFLSNDRINGRAKRIAKDQEPLLLSSHRGHLRAIISIIYLDIPKIIITGSYDCTVRMWTIGGRYLRTLGSIVSTPKLLRNECIDEMNTEFRIPPDIHKVSSATTLKVLSGIITDSLSNQIQLQKDLELLRNTIKLTETDNFENSTTITGYANDNKQKCRHWYKIQDPILGKHFNDGEICKNRDNPILDKSLPYIPVYAHLRLDKTKNIEKPTTSDDTLKIVKKIEFMQYYKPKI